MTYPYHLAPMIFGNLVESIQMHARRAGDDETLARADEAALFVGRAAPFEAAAHAVARLVGHLHAVARGIEEGLRHGSASDASFLARVADEIEACWMHAWRTNRNWAEENRQSAFRRACREGRVTIHPDGRMSVRLPDRMGAPAGLGRCRYENGRLVLM